MKQTTFFPNQKNYFGGSLLRGQRKSGRPLSSKKPIHLVLKSKYPTLFKNRATVLGSLAKYSKKFGVKIYSKSVQRDHVHLSVRIHNRIQYKKFIRSLTGYLARKLGKGIWRVRPFSRIGQWGKDFRGVQSYIEQNELEVNGLVPYKPRNHRYKINSP